MADNIDGHVIYFCDETARIAKPCAKDKHRPVVGMPVISVKIGDHCYHGLCYMGASASTIPIDLYTEIMHDIAPVTVEEKIITYNDPIVPTTYVEKPPFPVRIKDHAKASTMVRKSYTRTPTPLNKLNLNLVLLWLRISWLIILMGMLFISVMKLLELLNLMIKINIDLLLACMLSLLE